VTNPATVTKSIGLPADALLSWFLHSHLDNFIIPWQILPLIGTKSSGQLHHDTKTLVRLPGLCKNACQPRHRRQLPIPPGR